MAIWKHFLPSPLAQWPYDLSIIFGSSLRINHYSKHGSSCDEKGSYGIYGSSSRRTCPHLVIPSLSTLQRAQGSARTGWRASPHKVKIRSPFEKAGQALSGASGAAVEGGREAQLSSLGLYRTRRFFQVNRR